MKINKVDSNEKHQIKNRRKGIKTMLAISASVVGAGAGIGIGYAIWHTNKTEPVAVIHAPNTLTSTVNKSGSFTLTATDSLNHPLINAQWHIITDYSNLFSVNETTGELSWTNRLDPSLTYNILITCSSDNLPDATHELQIIVQTPPGYNVIPFSQLVISGGIFEGLQRDGDYIAPPGASLIFPEEEHVYAIYKNALDVSKYSSDMQLQNISYIDFDNIVDVGDYAFNGLTGLTGELKISDNISHIGVNAFANTSYTTNNISGLSYSYTDDVHHNQWLIKSTLEDTVNYLKIDVFGIADQVFKNNTHIKTVEITTKLMITGNETFSGCSALESFDLATGESWEVLRIGAYCFQDCASLTSIDFHSAVEFVDIRAFFGCAGLQHIYNMDYVRTIASGAFMSCTSLRSISLQSCQTIAQGAFRNCTNLQEIWINTNQTPQNMNVSSNAFTNSASGNNQLGRFIDLNNGPNRDAMKTFFNNLSTDTYLKEWGYITGVTITDAPSTISGIKDSSITSTDEIITQDNFGIAMDNGYSVQYSVDGTLPDGLSINSNTGVISGTPSVVGTSTIKIQVITKYPFPAASFTFLSGDISISITE